MRSPVISFFHVLFIFSVISGVSPISLNSPKPINLILSYITFYVNFSVLMGPMALNSQSPLVFCHILFSFTFTERVIKSPKLLLPDI